MHRVRAVLDRLQSKSFRPAENVMVLIPFLRRFYAANEYNRDLWVSAKAAMTPAGSRVLDLGAGSGPFRLVFNHCTYTAMDFYKVSPDLLCRSPNFTKLSVIADATSIPMRAATF